MLVDHFLFPNCLLFAWDAPLLPVWLEPEGLAFGSVFAGLAFGSALGSAFGFAFGSALGLALGSLFD